MKKIFLYLAVCVSGGAVLILVIGGIRLLAPVYGISLFLLSALISISLLALGTGYWLGGRWPRKKVSFGVLNIILAASGIWIALIPFLKYLLLLLTEPLGLKIAGSVTIFIILFPPLTLIGLVNPYSIRLIATSLKETCRTASDIYAFSTISGIITALLTGYVFIPYIGIILLMLFTGCILMSISIIGWLFVIRKKNFIAGSLITLCIIVSISFLPNSDFYDATGEFSIAEQNILGDFYVIERDNERYFLLDGAMQNITDVTGYISHLHSSAVLDIPKYLFPQTGKILLLGVTNISLLHQYAGDNWKIDAIENNPSIIRIIRKYLKHDDANISLIEMDSRRFLSSTQESYDLILINGKIFPALFHIITEEAFGLASSHLRPGGILAINIETIGWNDIIIWQFCATLKVHFQNVIALPLEEPPDQIGEIVLLASNNKFELSRELEINTTLNPEWRFGPGYQKMHAWDNRFIPDTKNIQHFTDDCNPVDIRADIINIASREEHFPAFLKEKFIW